MNTTGSKPGLPGYDEALLDVLSHAPSLGEETIALRDALGRVLRGDLTADRDQPPFNRSAMDGFAVRAAQIEPGFDWPICGEVAAGGPAETFLNEMKASAVMRIATGAPLPRGADAVIPIEQAQVSGAGDDQHVRFNVDSCQPGQHVHRQASDARRGQVVLNGGRRLTPAAVGIAAAVGADQVNVTRQPRITLLTTGDEVRPPDTATGDLGPQQIRNSNGPMLAALFEALGAPLLDWQHIPDEPEQTLAAARQAMSHSHLVVTVGGVSVGQRDLLRWAWEKLGLHTVVHGVAIQPGKPLFIATPTPAPGSEADGSEAVHAGETASVIKGEPGASATLPANQFAQNKLVIGLPGNPVSVLTTAHLFVWPVLRRMLGQRSDLPWRMVRMADALTPRRSRQLFRAARLSSDGSAAVIQWHGSGDLMHTADADGFVRLPMQDEPIDAGAWVPFLPMVR